MSPFFANKGYHPRLSVTASSTTVPNAQERLEKIKEVHSMAQRNISKIHEQYSRYANRHRTSPPNFEVRSKVWLLRRHIKTTRPSSKLDAKKLGPFEITEKIGSHAFRLALPPSMKIHNVFHVSLLEKFHPNQLQLRQTPEPPPPIIEEYYEIEKILDTRIHRSKLQYLVRWKGYDPIEDQWISTKDVDPAHPQVRAFYSAHPSKPGAKHQSRSARP